ncbi:MAG: hypothetical protein JO367_05130 [Actinobacteria bacterium]|nr:hypothetical protein [Acidimicrobiia bacterium]MBV8692617.1 hypothetical protein [Actinomycetota bacterium]MBV9933665.1 hypothetical protein [Actinomycetota bacterium]
MADAEALRHPERVRDEALIKLFRDRDGVDSEVTLANGIRIIVRNIAWGYDDADEWAHVTTNISPEVAGYSVDTFSTKDVVLVSDRASGTALYTRP